MEVDADVVSSEVSRLRLPVCVVLVLLVCSAMFRDSL